MTPHACCLIATLLTAALLPGCIVLSGVNVPEMADRFKEDPVAITKWTLAQTDMDEIFKGYDALRYLMAKGSEPAFDGWVQINQALRKDWPGIKPKSREWLLKRNYEFPVDQWVDTGKERWKQLFWQLQPEPSDPYLAMWREEGARGGLVQGVADSK